MQKIKSLALVLVFLFCLCGVIAGCGDTDPETNQEKDSVTSIKLRYNNKAISGDSLTVNMSLGTMTFTANVQVTGKASTDFTLESTNTGVATVSGKTVTLLGPGQTTITGTAVGDATKTHAITLNVFVFPKPYNITNNFGEDSSTEFLAQWHNDSDVDTQKLQIVTETGDFVNAREITVTGVPFEGLPEAEPPNNIGDYPLRNVFRAHVDNLSPNTRYKYRMGNAGAWSDTFYHLTSGGSFADFSFTVVTDPQNGEHSAMITTLTAANDFDADNRFFLMLGDIVNDTGKNPDEIVSYTEAANEFNINTPISATQGNHDTYRNVSTNDQYVFGEASVFNAFVTFPDNGWDTHEDKANRSQAYYYYYNNVLIIMLNTMATSADAGTAEPNHNQQAAWLRQILQNDRDNGLSKYTIVATHVSPFGGRSSERWLQANVRAAYGPICSEFGVDIFFAGHDHVYGRSNPIKIQTGQTALSAMDFNETPGGTIYSIISATGPKFYEIDANDTWVPQYFPVTFSAGTSTTQPGVFVNVKVTEEKLTVTAMRADGEELDTYEVEAK